MIADDFVIFCSRVSQREKHWEGIQWWYGAGQNKVPSAENQDTLACGEREKTKQMGDIKQKIQDQ